jgi:hypothetical protein
LRITANAQDPSGVKSVPLTYRHPTQSEDYRIAMTRDPKTGSYTPVIPGDFIAQNWDLMYIVETADVRLI